MQKAEVIDELVRVAKLLDTQCMSRSSYKKHGRISSATVEQTFGSWNEAVVAAGLTPFPQGGMPKDEERRIGRIANPIAAGGSRIPDDLLLDDLLRLERELGRRPSGNQIGAKGKYDQTVYVRRWGSVAAAHAAAHARGRQAKSE
jgi:hypothetical protein